MRFVLTLLLALATSPAFAGWEKVVETDGFVDYIDPATLRKDGNFQKVWKLHDRKQRSADGAMSRRMLEEFDCLKLRNRTLSFSLHSESMGGGRTIITVNTPAPWENKTPALIDASTNGVVCGANAQADDPRVPGGSFRP